MNNSKILKILLMSFTDILKQGIRLFWECADREKTRKEVL